MSAKIPFEHSVLNSLELEARSKYSDLLDEKNVRTLAGISGLFFNNIFRLSFKWLNMVNIDSNEYGNLWMIQVKAGLFNFLSADFRWNYYKAPDYFSSTYAMGIPLYLGDLSVKPYNGEGNEYTLVVKIDLFKIMDVSLKTTYDTKEPNDLVFMAFAQAKL